MKRLREKEEVKKSSKVNLKESRIDRLDLRQVRIFFEIGWA
jgi:hypothetical protein